MLTALTRLPEVARTIRELDSQHRLKALLMRADVDPLFLPHMLARAGVKQLRSMIVYSEPILVHRVIAAWNADLQNALIAKATVTGDGLLVVTCGLEMLEVLFQQVPSLRSIPEGERDRFQVSEEGSYIHWPGPDVHLDLYALRYATDKAYQKKADAVRLFSNAAYGNGIARLRKRTGLVQLDIPGLSERQVRRIEKGEQVPSMKALELLAQAHRMALDNYLDAVAQAMQAAKQGQAA